MLREDQIKLVMGPDNRPTGEAFVEITGPGADLASALAKDRQVMPVCRLPAHAGCKMVRVSQCLAVLARHRGLEILLQRKPLIVNHYIKFWHRASCRTRHGTWRSSRLHGTRLTG